MNAAIATAATAEPATLQVHPPGESGWLPPAEVAALTPEGVRERLRALQPLITAHALESERLGYTHPRVWDAIRATGFFYHFVPKRFGGCEFGPEDFFRTSRVIAEACASTAWAATFLVEHNWVAALYPESAQQQFFAGGRYILAPAVSTPPGRATPVPGGYRVSARWKYGSGVMHSNWCMGQALIEGESPPAIGWVAFPLAEARVLDTWQVQGLLATGSNDIVVQDLFVPEHLMVRSSDLQNGTTPGAGLHANPVYRMPSSAFLGLVTSAPAIGAARGTVNIFRERLKTRKVLGTQVVLAEKANMQVMLATAELMVRTAELVFESCAADVHELARRNRSTDIAARMEIVARNTHAAHMARDAVRLMVDHSGSSVHHLSDPLQRMLRDATVACSHVIQDDQVLAEQYGRSLLGLPQITSIC